MSKENKAQPQLLTSGSIFSTLFRFALPFMGASFLQAMYGFCDILIISYFTNQSVLSGVSNATQILWFWIFLASGLTMGGTILIGQYFGAGDKKQVQETITTMFSLFIYVGLFFGILLILLLPFVVQILQIPNDAVPHAKSYILVSMAGLVFTFCYHSICAVLRGLGDSKSPLYFVFVACIVNIVLDLIFVGVFHLDAFGAALATILAQAVSVIIGLMYLHKQKFEFSFRFRLNGVIKEKALQIVKVGLPISMQDSLLMISFLVVLSAINKLGVTASAAAGITDKLDALTFLPPIAISGAVSAMVAQNIGAHKLMRAKKVMFSGILLSLAFGVPTFLVAFFTPEFILGLTTSDGALITTGSAYLKAYSPDVLFLCVIFSVNAFLNGCGKTNVTFLNSTFANVFIRIPIAFMATDIIGIGLSMLTAAFSQITIGLLYFYSNLWKKSLLSKKKS